MPNKKLSFYLAIASIPLTTWDLYNNLMPRYAHGNPGYLWQALDLVYLGLPFGNGVLGYNDVNYANAVFYGLLLLGSIFYLASSGREVRLFRAAFAIIFLYNIVIFLYGICFILLGPAMPNQATGMLLFRIFFYLKELLLIWLSWRLLRYFDQYKTVETEVHEHNGETLSFAVEADIWQRITHTLLDTLIIVFIFSPLFESMAFFLSRHRGVPFDNQLMDYKSILWLVFLICRVIYYIICEGTIGSTPAKMMTETRVIDDEGMQPGFRRMLGRTFARLIPFDGASFLFKANWHDHLSGTHVVQESRTGKPGAVYYLLPVVLIISIVGYNAIRSGIAETKITKARNAEYELEQQTLKNQLQQPTNTEFFLLEKLYASNSYHTGPPGNLYLKVEQDKGDSVRFTKLLAHVYQYSLHDQQDIEHQYTASRDTLPQITLAKTDLKSAYLVNGYTLEDGKKALTLNGANYGIKSITYFFRPRVDLDGSNGSGFDSFEIGLKNNGWPVDIIKVDVLGGEGSLKSILPIRLQSTGFANGNAGITINTSHPDNDIKLNLTVRDTTGRQFRYQISGTVGISGTLRIQELK